MKSAFLGLGDLFRDEGIPAAGILDFSDIEGTCCYCDPDAASEIRKRLAGVPLEGIHWIDTGDYHYMTLLFMERISEPFELLLFDHHSDRQPSAFESWEDTAVPGFGDVVTGTEDGLGCAADGVASGAETAGDGAVGGGVASGVEAAGDGAVGGGAVGGGACGSRISGGMLSCGSWVARAVRTLPHLRNVMTVGTDDGSRLLSDYDSAPGGHGTNPPAAELPPQAPSLRLVPTRQAVPPVQMATGGHGPSDALHESAGTCFLPVDANLKSAGVLPLYLSVDLDILSKNEFVTDWDQGEMSYDELCREISSLVSGRRIIGIDVCGGITISKGATASDLSRNSLLRNRFLNFLKSLV